MLLTEQLETFLGNFNRLSSRIRHLNYDTDALGDHIDVRCSYIAFKDGKQTFDEFLEVLYHQIVSFCLPRSEITSAHDRIQRALADSDAVLVNQISTQLHERARSLFIKAKKGRRVDMSQDEARIWIRRQNIEALDIPSASAKEIRRLFQAA
ncbi:hypothetical protein [Pseudosulfitobacter sp. DSM 107133]|uniref:hypothetical protein n=1 Tax=Pseudosulfitobacter sp. DSM 107133 TaxID=2883100 RepID=UPI0013B38A7D|nr:hypothetical protein [Pseudosulfitobacter sp. DSM 107133]